MLLTNGDSCIGPCLFWLFVPLYVLCVFQGLYENAVKPEDVVKDPDEGCSSPLSCCFYCHCCGFQLQEFKRIFFTLLFSPVWAGNIMSDVAAAAPQVVKEAVQVMKVAHTHTHTHTDAKILSAHPQTHTNRHLTVHPERAETGWRPLRHPEHQAQSHRTGDPPGSARAQRPIRCSPAAGKWDPSEQRANQKSCRGSSGCSWICSPSEKACWLRLSLRKVGGHVTWGLDTLRGNRLKLDQPAL